jgi:hypothetical protein
MVSLGVPFFNILIGPCETAGTFWASASANLIVLPSLGPLLENFIAANIDINVTTTIALIDRICQPIVGCDMAVLGCLR